MSVLPLSSCAWADFARLSRFPPSASNHNAPQHLPTARSELGQAVNLEQELAAEFPSQIPAATGEVRLSRD